MSNKFTSKNWSKLRYLKRAFAFNMDARFLESWKKYILYDDKAESRAAPFWAFHCSGIFITSAVVILIIHHHRHYHSSSSSSSKSSSSSSSLQSLSSLSEVPHILGSWIGLISCDVWFLESCILCPFVQFSRYHVSFVYTCNIVISCNIICKMWHLKIMFCVHVFNLVDTMCLLCNIWK